MSAIVDFEEYFDPLYGSFMLLLPGCAFYRGYDTRYPPVSDWPSHYSTKHVASAYGSGNNRALGLFSNNKQSLKLIDYRYLKLLLTDLFQNRPDNTMATLDPIIRTSVGYGMCDITDQLHIGKNMFKNDTRGMAALEQYFNKNIRGKTYVQKPLDVNPVSTSGYRIAETNNDTFILQFLKECMGHVFDGFVSPRQASPYHVEKNGYMSPEMVIFSPEKVGIVQINETSLPRGLRTITMNDLLDYQSAKVTIEYKSLKATHRKRAQTAGGSDSIGATDEVFQAAYDKDKDARALLAAATKSGKKWKRHFIFHDQNARHPQTPVSDWNV